MKDYIGKRFIFATISIICVSITSCILKFTGQEYLEIVKWIAIAFVGGQTITDTVKLNKK